MIQGLPEDYQLCEFECNKAQCRMGEWKKCERHLHL